MKKLWIVACVAAATLAGCSMQATTRTTGAGVTGSAENVVIKYNAMGAPVLYWDVHEAVGDSTSGYVSWQNGGSYTKVRGDLVVEPVNGNLAEIVQEYNLQNTPHIAAP